QHPDPHQQPKEDLGPGRLRALGHRPDPDPAHAQPPQRGLPPRQARPARPHPASSGAGPRRGDAPQRVRARPAQARVASRMSQSAPAARVALCVARFYAELADKLEAGARSALYDAGVIDIDRFDVPGAFELPLVAKYAATSGTYDAVVCLGAVIRGETDDYVCTEAARGIQQVQLETGVPCGFGVLTVDTMEQALDRVIGGANRDTGRSAAEAALASLVVKDALLGEAGGAAVVPDAREAE